MSIVHIASVTEIVITTSYAFPSESFNTILMTLVANNSLVFDTYETKASIKAFEMHKSKKYPSVVVIVMLNFPLSF